jgi:hypothetical protein
MNVMGEIFNSSAFMLGFLPRNPKPCPTPAMGSFRFYDTSSDTSSEITKREKSVEIYPLFFSFFSFDFKALSLPVGQTLNARHSEIV